MAGNILKRK